METEEICWESQKGKERETDVEREKGGQGGRQMGRGEGMLQFCPCPWRGLGTVAGWEVPDCGPSWNKVR